MISSLSICPTCAFKISLIEIEFVNKRDQICNDPKMNTSEKADKLSELILSYKLNICCNRILQTSVDYSDLLIKAF